jgi:hypothetical protein
MDRWNEYHPAWQIAIILAVAGIVAITCYVVIVVLGVGYHMSGPIG